MPSAGHDDWDSHWSKYGGSAELGPAPGFRRRLIFSALQLAGNGSEQILEIGSGTGEFAEAIRANHPGIKYLGLELSQTGVEVAARRVPAATFLQADLSKPIGSGQVPKDFKATHAVCSEVLEHVDDPVSLLRHASALMGQSCRLVVTVPGGPMSEFDRHIGHRKHFTSMDLAAILTEAGFEVSYSRGAGFPFFAIYRILVILRGGKLKSDINRPPSPLARLLFRIFDVLFRMNSKRYGWQMVAVGFYRPASYRTNPSR